MARRRATTWQHPLFRGFRRLIAGALVLSLLLALVTYAPSGSGRGTFLGAVGHAVAEPLLAVFGFSVFVLFGALLHWRGRELFRRRRQHPGLTACGILLATLCISALCALALDASAWRGHGLYGPGGLAGAGLANRLAFLTGTAGAWVLATLVGLLGLVLATDGVLLAVARSTGTSGRELSERAARTAGRLRTAWSSFREWRAARSTARSTATAVEAPPKRPVPPQPKPEPRPIETEPTPPLFPDLELDEEPEDGFEEPDAEGGDFEDMDEEMDEDELEAELPAPRSSRRRPAAGKRANRKGGGGYRFPPLTLLDPGKQRDPRQQEASIQENAEVLEETLRDFKVDAEVVDYTRGPVVTLYELDLAAGVKVNRIHNLAEDLAVALKAPSVRVVAPLPGKSTIGVEVPNPVRDDVRLKPLISSGAIDRHPSYLPLFLGADVAGQTIIEDLSGMPHLLIAGATGSGKSVAINSILLSFLMTRTPEQVRLILIDPKQVELAFFSKVPHLMTPVVTDPKKALGVLEWLVDQMEQRYALFHAMEVRNIHSYNEMGARKIAERKVAMGIAPEDEGEGIGFPEHLPYIVIVVDELADLMMVAGKEIENQVTRLAQKSRAVGIHIVLATQRPSTDVITGLIKANMPCRISFQVASKIDSRVVLDQNGAEKLLGRGDMLYLPPRTSHLARAQCTFVSDGEVKRVVKFLADQAQQEFEPSLDQAQAGPSLRDDEKDPLYDEAVRVVLESQRGSASLLQRALNVGYTRGSRIMDQMHKEGIVGAYKGSKAREVLLTLEEYEALLVPGDGDHS